MDGANAFAELLIRGSPAKPSKSRPDFNGVLKAELIKRVRADACDVGVLAREPREVNKLSASGALSQAAKQRVLCAKPVVANEI